MVFMQGAPGKCSLVPRRPLLGLGKMRAPESNSQDAFSFWFVTQVEGNPGFSLLLLYARDLPFQDMDLLKEGAWKQDRVGCWKLSSCLPVELVFSKSS